MNECTENDGDTVLIHTFPKDNKYNKQRKVVHARIRGNIQSHRSQILSSIIYQNEQIKTKKPRKRKTEKAASTKHKEETRHRH
mmetsp:Transcript_39408/g.63007  ORF Transcript_39408/g.63007 Transcript_39408/m.63007 type:complete len:83 (-) Transcript_39408:1724-1972(-)